MSQEPCEAPAPPQPTLEHKKLAEHVGTWKVACSFYMDPSQPPMQVEARETVEMFGPFWTISLFEADMFGAPFKGRATLGFEPKAGRYVSTWFDTMTPSLYHFTGTFDASGKVLEMSGEGIDCSTDRMTTYRTTEEHKSPDERVFEMFMTMPDGSEFKLFTHVYTRVK
jgi:hypothetical protein